MLSLPYYQYPLQSGTFVTTDEPTLTHHSQPKSSVYITVHSCHCIFYGFGHIDNDLYPSLWYHTEYFSLPLKSFMLHLFIPPCLTNTDFFFFFYCLHRFAFSRMSYNWSILYIAFWYWFLSLSSNTRFLYDFLWLHGTCF